MSHEVPEISLKEMLMVPDGPPAAVWERALEAAFAAEEQDGGPDGASPALAAAAAGTEAEADIDADDDTDDDTDDDAGEDDPDMDGVPAGYFAAAPDPALGGDEPEPDRWYSEDEVQGDDNDVEY
jgi:hypothetical protein